MKISHFKSIFLFFPLLILYILIAFLVIDNGLGGDQARYLQYAENLINGTYAIDGALFLWNGPGYPLLLAPFVFLNASIVFLKSLNIIFIFSGVYFFHKTCLEFFNKKQAIICSYILGLYYPNLLFSLKYILTEGFAFFLACGLLFYLTIAIKKGKRKHILVASIYLVLLLLTKVIFAYVIFGLIGISLFALAIKKFKSPAKRILIICVFANVLSLPYLFYTYTLTNKFPYYSNAGGQCIYWLSTPYENEQGEWVLASDKYFKTKPQYKNHNTFLSSISNLKPVEKDASLKEKAIAQIKQNPKKFVKNYISNISRLFLDIPNSYTPQNIGFIFYAVPNSFVFVFLCLSILFNFLNLKKLPFSILVILTFVLIYLFGSSLLCAYPRILYPILPFLFLWIFYSTFNFKTKNNFNI
ncbi:hypothetical protein PK35_11535 [Tamlana nanhaiensis]|uniref:Glycosyltransferase RgtA/B/C/D-like domain-containing protein n=1 Tax=Neotamlana nanhaiensis TaxID=1382798 RepID=A0A0D7VYV3_9FLAO|nr:hypothetical protein [Tamlana nanhaiensis]KJD32065.1 hypothetical protein PK35_10650 [Tamlana nanhaiensis]KJD32227.1 hypothetical protein PK35_11535 [Tamlana nanhaiensis]